jgi:predicted RNA-binding protein with TRAM domain
MEILGIEKGELVDLQIRAKTPHGEGIGKVRETMVFVRNAKTRMGKSYKVRITDVHRSFAYAELAEENNYPEVTYSSMIA